MALSAVPAVLSLRVYTPREAATFGAILLGIFLLAYGANRLQWWMARPAMAPIKAALLGAVVFVPLFLGVLPFSPVLHDLAGNHDYQNTPSGFWILPVSLWGLFAPVGVLAGGLRQFRADLNRTHRKLS